MNNRKISKGMIKTNKYVIGYIIKLLFEIYIFYNTKLIFMHKFFYYAR
jgi:hypothetical protein